MEPQEIIGDKDTITAISTPPGIGGIAVIRLSGKNAIDIANSAWKGADLNQVDSHTVHLGKYISLEGEIIDEGVATVFRSPASFTGENTVELGVHGSSFIQREVLADLVRRGARIANPGEFTQRAFLNGKLDLAQAEGVADLISASSKAAHDMAINQTKGSFSKEFNALRDKLIEFASLLELELDFSEEEVEFADRSDLKFLCKEILHKVDSLKNSFAHGEVLKNGVPVVIAGIPNAGKSSLLNLLLNEEKAIVTDIPGTTRDIIEDTIELNGILYRFIDTAGLRETGDIVEGIGVNRAIAAMDKAYIVIWIVDPTQDIEPQLNKIAEFKGSHPEKKLIILINKADLQEENNCKKLNINDIDPKLFNINNKAELANEELSKTEKVSANKFILFSAISHVGVEELKERLHALAQSDLNPLSDIIISNARHFEALSQASHSLSRALDGLENNLSTELIAQDIREATSFLSLITGSISSTTLLHSIFSRFCIGK